MGRVDDLTGRRFYRLTVLELAGLRGNSILWRCRCECSAIKVVEAQQLRDGHTKSCGCLRVEWARERMTRHGATGKQHPHRETPTYESWSAMKSRCLRTRDKSFDRYAGRGITVCEHWLLFDNFLADMGERPDGTTLDRIDNEGNYEPGNCRWATGSVQIRNRRPRPHWSLVFKTARALLAAE